MAREPRISETASKNRRPRGRPWMLAPEYEQALQHLFPDIQARRHLQNVAYRQRALALLSDDPAYRWLCDAEAMQRGQLSAPFQKSWRPGILAELGGSSMMRTFGESVPKRSLGTRGSPAAIWRLAARLASRRV